MHTCRKMSTIRTYNIFTDDNMLLHCIYTLKSNGAPREMKSENRGHEHFDLRYLGGCGWYIMAR